MAIKMKNFSTKLDLARSCFQFCHPQSRLRQIMMARGVYPYIFFNTSLMRKWGLCKLQLLFMVVLPRVQQIATSAEAPFIVKRDFLSNKYLMANICAVFMGQILTSSYRPFYISTISLQIMKHEIKNFYFVPTNISEIFGCV